MMVVIGMLLLAGGGIVQRIAARGFAGSGRCWTEKPQMPSPIWPAAWSGRRRGLPGWAERPQEVKVRCPHCKALNDETDKFCGQCGKS